MPCVNIGFLVLSISTISTVVFPVVYYSLPDSFSQMKSSLMESVQKRGLLRWATEEHKTQVTADKTQRSTSSVSETLMDNVFSRISNATFSEDTAIGKEDHNVMTSLLWGTNLALIGHFAFSLCTQGFALFPGPTLVMAVTSSIYAVFQYAIKENIPPAILDPGDKTILEKLWCMMGLQEEEVITIVPCEEVGALQKLLKNVFPGVEMNGSCSIFKRFMLSISDIVGLEWGSILSAIAMAYLLAFVLEYLYDIFLKGMEKKYWTDEEILEDFAYNETLHKDLVEWMAVVKSENWDNESSDLTDEN